jgi:hypothetical protein
MEDFVSPRDVVVSSQLGRARADHHQRMLTNDIDGTFARWDASPWLRQRQNETFGVSIDM